MGAGPARSAELRIGGFPGRRDDVPARIGVLDLGTNTLSMTALFGDVREPRRLRVAEELQFVTGLGKERAPDGSLSPDGMRRAWSALRHASNRLAALGVPERGIRGAATAACREAPNGPEFLEHVRTGLGLPFQVIAGAEEARLVALSQARSFPDRLPLVAVDIGGGSTEVVVVEERGRIGWSRSIPFGATKLAARVGPDHTETQVREAVRAVLDAEELPRGYGAVGVAGTVTAAVQVLDDAALWDPATQHGRTLTLEQTLRIARRLIAMPSAARHALPCVHPGRADALGPALIWLAELMGDLGVEAVVTSDRGVRFGLLWDAWPGVVVL